MHLVIEFGQTDGIFYILQASQGAFMAVCTYAHRHIFLQSRTRLRVRFILHRGNSEIAAHSRV